jgi:predicted nucleic acid-binding protein
MARARKPRALVFDSWAIIAYLEGEPSAQKIADHIADAHDDGISLFISVVNAGEVWYIIARETSISDADRSILQLRQLGIKFVDVNWTLAHEAGSYKSKHKMSFADCFAAALAKQERAVLLTGDPEFKQVEKEITINWL